MSEWVIGIIGGSGLYAIEALEDAQWLAVDTPWGKPSDALLIGRIEGVRFVFLPRHGRGHRIPPSDLNARANVDALKRVIAKKAKAKGKRVLEDVEEPGPLSGGSNVIDLMAALKASVEGKKKAAAGRAKTAPAKKAPAKKTAERKRA